VYASKTRKEKFSGPGENCQRYVTDLAGSLVTSCRPPGRPQKRPDDRTWNAIWLPCVLWIAYVFGSQKNEKSSWSCEEQCCKLIPRLFFIQTMHLPNEFWDIYVRVVECQTCTAATAVYEYYFWNVFESEMPSAPNCLGWGGYSAPYLRCRPPLPSSVVHSTRETCFKH